MNREIKFRIWDLSKNAFVENSASLHCFSQWVIDVHTGKVYNAVGTVDGDHEDSSIRTLDSADYYFKQCRRTKKNKSGLKVIKKSPYILQQFTGVKDCKGNELCEGDIIDVDTRFVKGVVNFNNGSFCILGIPIYEYKTTTHPKRYARLTILGNIFENPELLK